MDLQARLEAARQAASDGRHAEALREYVWFHHHALDHDEAFTGVRLSFALAWWLELADAYPPARTALLEIRDAKAAQLRTGEGAWRTFQDVASINRYLGADPETYELFRDLDAKKPEVAADCARFGWKSAAACRDYALARRYVGDPRERLEQWSSDLNEGIPELPDDFPMPRETVEGAFVHNYSVQVRSLLEVLRNVGDADEAEMVYAAALQAVRSTTLRELVRRALVATEA